MAVTLISNPQGHKLDPEVYPGTITDSGGDALITTIAGAPFAGQWVYIESNINRYNGFMYVLSPSGNTYKITPTEGGDPVEYIQDADAVIQISVLEHAWQSVHLPIVYRMKSDLFPLNIPEEEDVHNPIASFSNSNGHVQITTTNEMSDPGTLDFIELRGNGPLAGVYQITSEVNLFNAVIDLAYNASYDFSPYYVVKYYNNYFITVNVYAGLESNHRWTDEKPSELAAVLRLIPDSNNEIKFSISEIVKAYIMTRNNLTLDTLPNNIDFYSQFHIDWFESYDEVVDGEIVVFNGDVEQGTFVGSAVNSMMPFKSLNEGFMSDYIALPGESLARWLTLFDRPVAVVGHFFDMSFLLNNAQDLTVTIFKGSNGIVTDTEIIEIPNPGLGVIRVPIIPEGGYDLYCMQVQSESPVVELDLSDFGNTSTGADWTLGASPSRSGSPSTKILFLDVALTAGASYNFNLVFTYSTSGGSSNDVILGIYDSVNVIQFSETDPMPIGNGTHEMSLSFVGNSNTTRIGVRLTSGMVGNMNIDSISYYAGMVNITEQICIDVIEECEDTFTNDNLRITENGYFRELE